MQGGLANGAAGDCPWLTDRLRVFAGHQVPWLADEWGEVHVSELRGFAACGREAHQKVVKVWKSAQNRSTQDQVGHPPCRLTLHAGRRCRRERSIHKAAYGETPPCAVQRSEQGARGEADEFRKQRNGRNALTGGHC